MELLNILSYAIQELVLTKIISPSLWYSVICSDTHNQNNQGVKCPGLQYSHQSLGTVLATDVRGFQNVNFELVLFVS